MLANVGLSVSAAHAASSGTARPSEPKHRPFSPGAWTEKNRQGDAPQTHMHAPLAGDRGLGAGDRARKFSTTKGHVGAIGCGF